MLAPFLLGLLNTYLTLNSLSILAILSKYFEFRFTFCAHFRNLEGLEGFHSLCLQHLTNTGPHHLSILKNFHFIARKPATSKTLNFHFNEFPFHRECTVCAPHASAPPVRRSDMLVATADCLSSRGEKLGDGPGSWSASSISRVTESKNPLYGKWICGPGSV